MSTNINPPIPILKDMSDAQLQAIVDLTEARILNISKDDLRMSESQLFWDDNLQKDVLDYWTSLNSHWEKRTLPQCTCADYEGGFMSKEKWNPFYYGGEPCSLAYYERCKEEGLLKK